MLQLTSGHADSIYKTTASTYSVPAAMGHVTPSLQASAWGSGKGTGTPPISPYSLLVRSVNASSTRQLGYKTGTWKLCYTKRLLGVNVIVTVSFVPFTSTHGEPEHPSNTTLLMTILVEPAWVGTTWLLEQSENRLRYAYHSLSMASHELGYTELGQLRNSQAPTQLPTCTLYYRFGVSYQLRNLIYAKSGETVGWFKRAWWYIYHVIRSPVFDIITPRRYNHEDGD